MSPRWILTASLLGASGGACVLEWEAEDQEGRFRCAENADCAASFICLGGFCTLCGNNQTDDGEQCDDGNRTDGDGCDSNCTATRCGNGIPTANEECDDGNGVITDACLDHPDRGCKNARCGDGVLYEGVEICDWPNSDTLHGYCGEAAGANETAVDTGPCGLICRLGYRECDGFRPPGSSTAWGANAGALVCETDIFATDDACGACASPCAALEACVAGTCRTSALELQADVGFAEQTPMAVDATHLYWVTSGDPTDTIARVALGGSSIETIFSTTDDVGLFNAVNLAVDDTYVYFAGRAAGGGQLANGIYRLAKTGLGAAELLVANSDAFVIDATTVYVNVWSAPTGRVLAVPKSNPAAPTELLSLPTYLLGMVQNATHLLVGSGNGAYLLAKGGPPSPLKLLDSTATTAPNPQPFALGTAWGYIRTPLATGAFRRISIDGSKQNLEVFPAGGTVGLTALQASGAYVYARVETATGIELLRWPVGAVPSLTRFLEPVGDPRAPDPNASPLLLGNFGFAGGTVFVLYRIENRRSILLALPE